MLTTPYAAAWLRTLLGLPLAPLELLHAFVASQVALAFHAITDIHPKLAVGGRSRGSWPQAACFQGLLAGLAALERADGSVLCLPMQGLLASSHAVAQLQLRGEQQGTGGQQQGAAGHWELALRPQGLLKALGAGVRRCGQGGCMPCCLPQHAYMPQRLPSAKG